MIDIISLIERFGFITVLCVFIWTGVRRLLDHMTKAAITRAAVQEEEKPKRKRRAPIDLLSARLQEIDEEAEYQRSLAYDDYVDALKSTAQPLIVVSGSATELYEDDSDFLIYKDER